MPTKIDFHFSENGTNKINRPLEYYPLGTKIYSPSETRIHRGRNRWEVVETFTVKDSSEPTLAEMPKDKFYLQPCRFSCLHACLATIFELPLAYVLEVFPAEYEYSWDGLNKICKDHGVGWMQCPLPLECTGIPNGIYIIGTKEPISHVCLASIEDNKIRPIHDPICGLPFAKEYNFDTIWLFPKLRTLV